MTVKKQKSSGRVHSSRRFVLIIVGVFTAAIITYALTLSMMIRELGETVTASLVAQREEAAIDKAIAKSLNIAPAASPEKALMILADRFGRDREALSIVLLQPTSDDSVFQVIAQQNLDPGFPAVLVPGNRVTGTDSSRYFRQGLDAPILEPTVHEENNFAWRSLHFPLRLKKRTYVAVAALSEKPARDRLAVIDGKILKTNQSFLVISLALLIIATAAALLFHQNHQRLITRLNHHLRRAADGELDVAIRENGDGDIRELAHSFNSLIGELREIQDQRDDSKSGHFKQAVEALNRGDLERSRALFTALLDANPVSFGVLFNLGVTHARLKQYGNAIECFRRAEKINPLHEKNREYLARARSLHEKKSS